MRTSGLLGIRSIEGKVGLQPSWTLTHYDQFSRITKLLNVQILFLQICLHFLFPHLCLKNGKNEGEF